MLEIPIIIAIAFILLVTTTVGATMGYGLGLIALPFCCFFLSVKMVVPLIGTLSGMASIYLAYKSRRDIDVAAYLRMLVWVAIGFPIGMLAFYGFDIEILNYFLGVFIIVVAIQGLWNSYHGISTRPWPNFFGRSVLIFGGLIHGAFVTGGPPIVAYAERELKNKNQFRATMLALWAVLNPVFILIYWLSPGRNISVLWLILFCLPSVIAGMYIGQHLHRKVPELLFRRIVFILLLLAGVSRFVPKSDKQPVTPQEQGDRGGQPTVSVLTDNHQGVSHEFKTESAGVPQ